MGQLAAFDYSVCTTDEKSKLIWAASEVGRLKAKGAELVIETGKVLAIAQEQLANQKNGVFLEWLEKECGLSKSTAYRSIQAFRVFGKYLPNLGRYEVSALYELSEEKTPEKAIQESLKLAASGEKITHDRAKEIIKKHAEKPVEKPSPRQEPKQEPTAELIVPLAQEEPEPDEPETDDEPEELDEPESPDSLEAVQEDLRDLERQVRDLCRAVRKVLGAEGNEVTRPWCGCYSLLTLLHPLQHVARTILNDLPIGGTPENPKLAREEAVEKAG